MDVYNTKLLIYPNGSAQIRKYSKPLKAKQYKQNIENFSYQEECILSKGGSVWKNKVEYVMNPFDKSIVPNVRAFEDKEEKISNESDIIHSKNRTVNKIHSYSRCVKWEWFLTITFCKEKVNRYDYEECSRLLRSWLHNQRRNAPDLQYLIVPEQHKDGAWHFHGLLANTGKIKFVDSGKKKKGKKIYNMSKWANGFTEASKVVSFHAVSKYISKYITKSLCEMTKGKQRYFVSQNMPAPKEFTFLFDDNTEDFIQFASTLSDSLGYDVVYVSECKNDNAFVGVDYFELQDRTNTE